MKLFKRFVGLVIVLIGVSVLSFILSSISNVDPAEAIARQQVSNPTPELIESIRIEHKLDRPIVEQYFCWTGRMIKGDFGVSYMTGELVISGISKHLPVTLAISGLALMFVIITTLIIGILCTIYRNAFFDRLIRWISIIGICIPVFWIGFLLLLVFAIQLSWFSIVPEAGIKGYLLPALALGIPSSCSSVRIFRGALLEEMNKDYVVFLRSRGCSEWKIVCKHVLRNALPPMVTIFASYGGYLIAGAAMVEVIFSIDGFGGFLVNAVLARDLPIISASVLIIACIFVILNIGADFINTLLYPELRKGN